MKKVSSVLGDLKADQLGATLCHEHFSLNFEKFYREPPSHIKEFFGPKITLDTVGLVKQFPYGSRTNVDFYGKDVEDALMKEMNLFKKCGGGTVVENTTLGLQRDLDLSYRVAKDTGVNIIAGAGYYVEGVQPVGTLSMSVEALSDVMRNDTTKGVTIKSSPTPVKCGILGEIASSWPITNFEKRVIQAAAVVQNEVGCAVNFHPGRDKRAPAEIIRLFTEAGGKVRNANMDHLDRTLQTKEDLLDFAKLGTFCEFDLFGTETSFYMLAPELDMPSDAQRIDRIKWLIADGYADKIVVSHDIHTKHRLMNFGGHGFAHLLNGVRPQMLVKGVSEDNLDKIFVRNPANWLCH